MATPPKCATHVTDTTIKCSWSGAFGTKSVESEACTREEKQPEVRAYAEIAEIAVTDGIRPIDGDDKVLSSKRGGSLHMDVTERAINPPNPSGLLAEEEPITRGKTKKKAEKGAILPRGIRRPSEGSVLPSHPGISDGVSSDATQDSAHSRVETCDGAAAADGTTEGGTATQDASGNPDF
ncbi:hypothetical protein EVAR_16964_1 [Eumeta japonica]|uniref:Uncharacterized protein n=1 Tax=Eumeta variegata TaxID=151549 RepID=A0A4C1TVS8_EUMVA|nr:hypothetical protein EVAR_16964_1 [Eumeta japonica]